MIKDSGNRREFDSGAVRDIAIIYQKLGNRVRHSLTEEFINSGYDMAVLKGGEG